MKTSFNNDSEKIKPLMDKVLSRKVSERRAAALNRAWTKGSNDPVSGVKVEAAYRG